MVESGYKVDWYIPERVILSQYWGQGNIENVKLGMARVNVLMESVASKTEPVHHILDITATTSVPPLAEIRKLMKQVRGKSAAKPRGWMLIVSNANKLIRFSGSLVQQTLGLQGRMLSTIDEATQFLKERDDSIDWRAETSMIDLNLDCGST